MFELFLSSLEKIKQKRDLVSNQRCPARSETTLSADEKSYCLYVQRTRCNSGVRIVKVWQHSNQKKKKKWDKVQLLSFPAAVIHPLMSRPWWSDSASNQGRLAVCSLCQGQSEADQLADSSSCPRVTRRTVQSRGDAAHNTQSWGSCCRVARQHNPGKRWDFQDFNCLFVACPICQLPNNVEKKSFELIILTHKWVWLFYFTCLCCFSDNLI